MFKQRPKVKIVLWIILAGAAFLTGRNLLIKRQEAQHIAPSNEQILQIDTPNTNGSSTYVSAIDWRADTSQIAFAAGYTVYVYDIQDDLSEQLFIIDTPNYSGISDIEWRTGSPQIAIAGSEIGVYHLQDDEWETLADPTNTGTASVAWSPDNSKLAMTGWDLSLWDAETGDIFTAPEDYVGWSYYGWAIWSPNSRYVTSEFNTWDESEIHVWDTLTGSVRMLEVEGIESPSLLGWSPQGEYLAVAEDRNGEVNIVRSDTETIIQTLNNSRRPASWSPDGEHFLSGRRNSPNLLIWDTTTWQVETTLKPRSRVRSREWHPTGQSVATVTDRGVHIWNIETGDYVAIQNDRTHPANTIAWSPDGNMLAVGTHHRSPAASQISVEPNTLTVWRISDLP